MVNGLKDFCIVPDEGAKGENEESGQCGTYTQSKRNHVYHTYVKDLTEKGLVYSCFMTEEIAQVRQSQEAEKELPGIYGKYAKYRDIIVGEAEKRIKAGEEYVVRLKSPGKPDGKFCLRTKLRDRLNT